MISPSIKRAAAEQKVNLLGCDFTGLRVREAESQPSQIASRLSFKVFITNATTATDVVESSEENQRRRVSSSSRLQETRRSGSSYHQPEALLPEPASALQAPGTRSEPILKQRQR